MTITTSIEILLQQLELKIKGSVHVEIKVFSELPAFLDSFSLETSRTGLHSSDAFELPIQFKLHAIHV